MDTKTVLFSGETEWTCAGIPTVVRFIKGEEHKALAVFIPGVAHSARIAYGGHAGSREEDFLAYWLVKAGYDFLGVAYPLECPTPMFSQLAPEMSIRDWGRQVACAARRVIDENGLRARVIPIGWSNGGKCVAAFNEAAAEYSLETDCYVTISGTPASFAVDLEPNISTAPQLSASSMESYAHRLDYFHSLIVKNAADNGGHIAVPRDIYMNKYVGNMPANIKSNGLRLENRQFTPDPLGYVSDSGALELSKLPLIVSLIPSDASDNRHALVDKATWGYYSVNKIFSLILNTLHYDVTKMPAADWERLKALVNALPERLSRTIKGNHFSFVGEFGARRAAELIDQLAAEVKAVKKELEGILNVAEIRF